MSTYYIARIEPYATAVRASVWSCEATDRPGSIAVANTAEGRGFRLMANASSTGIVYRETFAQRCIASTREGAIALLATHCARAVKLAEERLSIARDEASAVAALAVLS